MTTTKLIYLHGFASSPGSNKAVQFADALTARGIDALVPDLDEGDFRGLTISRMLALLDRLTARQGPGSVALIGSSLGAYVAALFAARSDRVCAMVLMAPAFEFLRRRTQQMSAAALAEWKRSGSMPVMHYARDRMEPISWGILEDARRHPNYPEISAPTLIFHGRQDEAVDHRFSERFVDENPSATLELLDSDHGLGDSVDLIIERSFSFLSRWIPDLGTAG